MSIAGLSVAEAATHFSPRGIYLDTGTLGLPPHEVTRTLHAIVDRWTTGEVRAQDLDACVTAARASFARLIGVSPSHVTVDTAASGLIGLVAASLPRQATVLCADGDFTSVLFPFLEREQAGELSVRSCPLEALADAIDERTSLVAVSAVQSFDGRLCEFESIRQACRRHGTQFLLDATQAVGWLPIAGNQFDYVVASAYKWLLSPRGTAFMSIRPERLASLRPRGPGWYAGQDIWSSIYGAPLRLASDARRLDISPAWFMWLGCAEALDFIERVGVQAIHQHDRMLSDTFLERLGRPPSGSAIVSIAGAGVFEALAAAGISASRRGGATRLCFHLHNSVRDAVVAADVVRRALA